MPWSPEVKAPCCIGRRFECVGNVRFPPGFMAVLACRLCPFSPQLKHDMFAKRELLVHNGQGATAKLSMDKHSKTLDFVIRGSAAEVAVFGPLLLDEIKATIHLPRWGEWAEGTLQSELVLCTHCIEKGTLHESVTVVKPSDEIKRTDIYLCADQQYSFQRTQFAQAAAQPIVADNEDIATWCHECCCQWLRQVNPGFWRYTAQADSQPQQLSGTRLLEMTADDWREDFGVSVADHLQLIEKSVRRLRLAQKEWQARKEQKKEKELESEKKEKEKSEKELHAMAGDVRDIKAGMQDLGSYVICCVCMFVR